MESGTSAKLESAGATHPVLLIEDEDDFRESLSALLELKGYAVESAPNGRAALSRLRAGPLPCIVIMDLMMPEMDGWQLRAAMLGDEKLAAVPAIVLSAVGAGEPQTPLQAVARLNKPVDIHELYRLLEEHC